MEKLVKMSVTIEVEASSKVETLVEVISKALEEAIKK